MLYIYDLNLIGRRFSAQPRLKVLIDSPVLNGIDERIETDVEKDEENREGVKHAVVVCVLGHIEESPDLVGEPENCEDD